MGGIVMKGCLGMEMDVMSESREIDIFELARLRREASGDVTLEAMPELAKALEGEAKVCECTWQASGLGEGAAGCRTHSAGAPRDAVRALRQILRHRH